MHEKLPALRPVDVVQVQGEDGQAYVVLHDPAHIATQPLAVSVTGYHALCNLDGRHSCAEIQAVYRRGLGAEVPADQILDLVAALDEALLLEGERVERARAEIKAAYFAAPARDNRAKHPDPAELRSEIEALLAAGSATPVERIRGLIAPHLDYVRGRSCYAAAYATLAAAPPADRYVLLGTNHGGTSQAIVATTKDFHTPLGLVRTDRAFLQELEAACGQPLCEHEHEHGPEHSIELQVQILQVILGARAFQIVPVLCPSPCLPPENDPDQRAEAVLDCLSDALRQLIAGRDQDTIVIAGADLSHVGQRFGDAEPTTAAFLSELERSDRELLGLLEARKEDEFVAKLSATQNPTRICSAGSIYATLRALPGHPCRLLAYHQAVDMAAETHVTCAAAIVT